MLSAATTGKAVTQDELLRLIDEAAADGRPTLNLAGKKLNELPLEIGQLTKLQSLDLNFDRLSSLPESIGQLSSLR